MSLFSDQNQKGQFSQQRLCCGQEVEWQREWEEQIEEEEKMK